MGNAAGKLREECVISSTETMGLESSTTYTKSTSNVIETPLGDLATVVASYDTTAGLTSNSVSSYFHDLGWRSRAYELATSWLKVSNSVAAASASLGGNYGEASPTGLGFELEDMANMELMTSSRLPPHLAANDAALSAALSAAAARSGGGGASDRAEQGSSCSAVKDSSSDGPYENSLTALAFAEAHRRLALHREVGVNEEYDLKFPNATWEDASTILYGAETSILFPGTKWGGLSTDPAIYIQSALESTLDAAMDLDDGRWCGSERE
jgi:hypothetical protein